MRAKRLIMDAVNVVALPMYAKELREGGEITTTFLRATSLVTALGWSLLAFVGILAFPVIRVLYGPQWDATVDPTRWLAAAMALVPMGFGMLVIDVPVLPVVQSAFLYVVLFGSLALLCGALLYYVVPDARGSAGFSPRGL